MRLAFRSGFSVNGFWGFRVWGEFARVWLCGDRGAISDPDQRPGGRLRQEPELQLKPAQKNPALAVDPQAQAHALSQVGVLAAHTACFKKSKSSGWPAGFQVKGVRLT